MATKLKEVDVVIVGLGWTGGIFIRPSDSFSLGASYRTGTKKNVTGVGRLTQILTGNAVVDASVAAGLPPAQGVKTVLRFPAMWSLGAAWLPAKDWTLEGNLNYVEWKVFTDLPLTFETTSSLDNSIVEDYENAAQIRLGAEHRLESWSYRFGYYYDDFAAPTESVSPLLPDAKRNGVTLGLGFMFGATKRWKSATCGSETTPHGCRHWVTQQPRRSTNLIPCGNGTLPAGMNCL